MALPCGGCIGCRLERSRQWALRCQHEASLYEDNAFVTLTFAEQFIEEQCGKERSLSKRHIQLFMKRLRKKFAQGFWYTDVEGNPQFYQRKEGIRYFYCGEYGPKLGRPHYHLCLFNVGFPDKYYLKSVNGQNYYRSPILEELWTFGMSVIGDVTYESAAYVARYCFKKVNGKGAEEHYSKKDPVTGDLIKVLPEFSQASLKPGIGKGWFDKFGLSDVYPRDEVIMNGKKMKPPKYYDRVLERINPQMLLDVKERRQEAARKRLHDKKYSRLRISEQITEIRMKRLVRSLESQG